MGQPFRLKLLVFAVIAFVFGLALGLGLDGQRSRPPASPAIVPSAPPTIAPTAAAASDAPAFSTVAAAVTPSVVRIQTRRGGSASVPRRFREFFGPPSDEDAPVPQLAGGSGVVVSANGYILTNNHVVDGADRILVTLVDKRGFDATVVGRDPTTDLAVVKIEATDLPAAYLGDSDDARVGEWVLAIGNPGFGSAPSLDFTVTSGIISAKGRPLDIINRELQAEANPAAAYAIEDFIQTDAVINPGNSGGPLVNMRGEVIGINTAIASGTGFYQGYGFAIPANLARRVLNDLLEYGQVRRAQLGIAITDVVVEDAELYRLPEIAGVLIEDFPGDSPARRSGLERHDVIVAIAGERVERVGQLQRLVAQRSPGETVDVDVIRYGEPLRFQVRLTEAPLPADIRARGSPRPDRDRSGLGIEVTELTRAVARQLGLDHVGGAVVLRVQPFSPAAGRLQRGDRVLHIDGETVESAEHLRRRIENARPGEILSFVVEGPGGRTRIANIRAP